MEKQGEGAQKERSMVYGGHESHQRPWGLLAPCRCGRMHSEPRPLRPWSLRESARLFPLCLPGWLPRLDV